MSKKPEPPIANDILRDPRSHFDAIVAQVRDYAIFTLDIAGRARSWNEGVHRVLGFEESEFLGADVAPIIFTPEAQASGAPAREFEQAIRTGQANDDRWMRRKDGSAFFAAGTTTAIRNEEGKVTGFVKVMRDQTQWMNTQSELQRTVEELARVDRERTAFIAVLAHELRNPLAPLSNVAQLLKKSAQDPSRIGSMALLIERQVTQMTRLIADLLDVSRIAHGKIELKRSVVELSAIVQQALEVVRPQAESLRHVISFARASEPLYVSFDAVRLVQVLVNLLNNAYKFTPEAGHIWISTEKEGELVATKIRDDGIGIPLAEQSHIFDMFNQVDSSKERSQGGLGIGLSLVRKLVELHGGTVQVYSAGQGTGSEFMIRLPYLPEGRQAVEAGHAATDERIHVRRILIVDDNVDAALSLAALLELEGHHASIAHSGETALKTAESEKPEVVVLDIGMPGMSGLKVAEHLRQHQHEPRPVIVALTGWNQPEDRRLTAQAGFDHHLVKPVDAAALREILASVGP